MVKNANWNAKEVVFFMDLNNNTSFCLTVIYKLKLNRKQFNRKFKLKTNNQIGFFLSKFKLKTIKIGFLFLLKQKM